MPLLFDIDAHGRLVPHSDEARRALADRAGRFLLLPSVGDLLLARRTPAIGGAAPRPRCTVAGDIGGLPIADFLGFVHHSRLSGVLTVSADGVERSIAFKDGEVRSAASTATGERLGEVAIRLGLATEAQLARAAAWAGPLVRALVGGGRPLRERPVEVPPRAAHRGVPRDPALARGHLRARGRGRPPSRPPRRSR